MMSVTAFAPATVSNVACGFDVLGFALHQPGDQVTARWASAGVHIADLAVSTRNQHGDVVVVGSAAARLDP